VTDTQTPGAGLYADGADICAADIDAADIDAEPAGFDVDRVLHTLAVMGAATAQRYGQATGAGDDAAAAALDACVDRGLAARRGPRDLYCLTPAGRERHAGRLPATVAALRPGLHAALDAFRLANREVKRECTRWQLRDGAPNPHDDPAYDAQIIDELAQAATRCGQVLAPLADADARFARYPARLEAALARARAGELRAVTGVMCESFHEVWMELHRDLLLSGGVERCAADE
jgi:hypothetical protein